MVITNGLPWFDDFASKTLNKACKKGFLVNYPTKLLCSEAPGNPVDGDHENDIVFESVNDSYYNNEDYVLGTFNPTYFHEIDDELVGLDYGDADIWKHYIFQNHGVFNDWTGRLGDLRLDYTE